MDDRKVIAKLEQDRKKYVEILKAAEKRLKTAPEGSVRVIKHGKGFQYFLRKEGSDTTGKYMRSSEHKKAAALIQKRYDQQIVKRVKEQIRVIDRFLSKYEPDILKRTYASLSEIRRRNIDPVEISDEEYIEKWSSFEYVQKEFREDIPEHYTSKNERVRSKSEVMIADALMNAGIPYRYECPLQLGDVILHPDFTVLRMSDRKTLYWEHLGMMDDMEYCQSMVQKIRTYESKGIYLGIDLIITMETSKYPINLAVIKKVIRTYIEG